MIGEGSVGPRSLESCLKLRSSESARIVQLGRGLMRTWQPPEGADPSLNVWRAPLSCRCKLRLCTMVSGDPNLPGSVTQIARGGHRAGLCVMAFTDASFRLSRLPVSDTQAPAAREHRESYEHPDSLPRNRLRRGEDWIWIRCRVTNQAGGA